MTASPIYRRRHEGPLVHSIRVALHDLGPDAATWVIFVILGVLLGAGLFGNP